MEELFTIQELTKQLKLSRQGIYSLTKEGKFPRGIKIGHARRWTASEINSFLKGGEE